MFLGEQKKLKLGFLNNISAEWVYLHNDKIIQVSRVDEADYIIYESNGDPISKIMKILSTYPHHKLVFILSGDMSSHINDTCIWFTNAVKQNGLAKQQTQIFVTNPAIFKYYEKQKQLNFMHYSLLTILLVFIYPKAFLSVALINNLS